MRAVPNGLAMKNTLVAFPEGLIIAVVWEVLPVGLGAHGDDTSAGHGGADLKLARHFTQSILAGKPSPIDVYRAIEYCLPGILGK